MYMYIRSVLLKASNFYIQDLISINILQDTTSVYKFVPLIGLTSQFSPAHAAYMIRVQEWIHHFCTLKGSVQSLYVMVCVITQVSKNWVGDEQG